MDGSDLAAYVSRIILVAGAILLIVGVIAGVVMGKVL